MPQNHVTAKAVVERALPSLTAAESLYLRAVASFETKYGESGTFKGSNNWGALTGAGDAGSIDHPDQAPGPNGPVTYTTKFRKYTTPEKGAIGLSGTLMKPVTRLAISRNSVDQAAAAQYAYGYYTGVSTVKPENIRNYALGLQRHIDDICKSTGERNPFSRTTGSQDGALAAWNAITRRSDTPATIAPSLFRQNEKHVAHALSGAAPIPPIVTQPAPATPASTLPPVVSVPAPTQRHFVLVEVPSPEVADALPSTASTTYDPKTGAWSSWKRKT